MEPIGAGARRPAPSSHPLYLLLPFLVWLYPGPLSAEGELPLEVRATRADLAYWLDNMLNFHRFSLEEAAPVCGKSVAELQDSLAVLDFKPSEAPLEPTGFDKPLKVLPYPGGRHPRIGFLNGAVEPQRGTKASVFLPWGDGDYVVVDLPEAIFSNLGLLFLAHTHVPTIWDKQGVKIENVDWTRHEDGSLTFRRELPNGVRFGSKMVPKPGEVEMEMWLENGTFEVLTGLRTQVCVMLKGAKGFNEQTRDRKTLASPVAAVKSAEADRWILVAFDHCGRVWENPPVPCIHSDPVFPDAGPGERVSVKGRLWLFEGEDIEGELKKGAQFPQ